MALKPLPRLILIAVVLGSAAFAAYKFVPKSSNTDPGPSQQAVSVSVPVSVPVAPVADQSNPSTLSVSVQAPALPFFSATGNGQAYGFNVDFLRLLLAQGDLPNIKETKFHGVDTYEQVPQQLLSNPTINIAIDGLTFQDNEPKGVVYTIPYIENFGYALIGPRTAQIRPDLSGAQIGILKGDSDVRGFVSSVYPKAQLVELTDATTGGQRTWINDAIRSGKVDAIVYDYPFAVAEIANTDLQFLVSKLPGSDIQYKIGVRSSDQALKEALNRSIRKAKASPEYADLIRKYFTSTNTVAVKAVTGGETTYVVKRGDTLSLIAAATLGNSMRYAEIEVRNNLANPNLISVGQKLVIPK